MWTGPGAPAASGYFLKAPLGSMYTRKASATDVTVYVKTATAGAAADWTALVGSNLAGFIPINLATVRKLGTSAFLNAAGNGGILATDTTPILNTINGDTDGAWRLTWAASAVDQIGFNVALPPDLDRTKNLLVKVRAAMAAAADTPIISLDSYFNEGDTKVEDDIPAITGATYATYTGTIAAADVPDDAVTFSCEMTPAAHGTDALYITAIWLEYTKK